MPQSRPDYDERLHVCQVCFGGMGQLEEYREERLPLSALLLLLQSWALRFEVEYLAGQYFFEPYPQRLMNLGDSASG